jgi:hypothetical protein
MKLLTSRIFWGLVLVLGGIILLLESLGVLEGSEVFWMVILAIAGILFLVALITNRGAWWAVIPGVSLLAIATGLGLETFGEVSGETLGSIILGGIGLSFLIVYLLESTNWWAIIPGGVLFTLAIVAGMEGGDFGMISGAVFFAGLGLTFVLVALLPNKVGRMTWAWIPGGILLILAVIILAGIESMFNYIWPVVVIAMGLYFILRTVLKRNN